MAAFTKLGTFDSFSLGFSVVHRRLWLLAVPLLLNLFLWLGPTLTAGPLTHDWLDLYSRLLRENPVVAETQGGTTADMLDTAQNIADAAGKENILRVLAFQTPSLPVDSAGSAGNWEIASGSVLVLALLGLFFLALTVASVYLTLVADAVRPEQRAVRRLPEWMGSNLLHLLGYYLLLVGVSVPALLGLTMMLTLVRLISDALAGFLLSMAVGLFMLVQFYLFFVPQAIFLARLGPVRAVRASMLVMARFFWSSLGFILLSWIIGTGFTLIFGSVSSWQPGGDAVDAVGASGLSVALTLIALIGHAYISTGLTAAAMVYFQNRALLLAAARNPGQRLSVPS